MVQRVMPQRTVLKQNLYADMQGFSLRAAVYCGANDREGLEQLCRYITHPALANEWVHGRTAGRVLLKLKAPGRNGTMHPVMPHSKFMQRLGARVARPAAYFSDRGRLFQSDRGRRNGVAGGAPG